MPVQLGGGCGYASPTGPEEGGSGTDRSKEHQSAPATPLTAGEEASARGAWEEARGHFEAALADGEIPEAFEGLGLAAWFQDDAETVFEARERAYHLYRERGDRRGAARLAAFLAMDYALLRAEEAVSQGWFRRAHRLLEDMAPAPEHGFLAIQEGVMAVDMARDTAGARRAAARVMEVGRAVGDIDLEMTGLALEGFALVSDGEVEEGMGRLDEATVAATGGEMRDPLMIGLTCCYMMYACERVRDFHRAAQWCDRMKVFCARAGLRFLLSICRAHYASILVTRGEWEEAEEELVPVVGDMLRTTPGIAHDGMTRLAELRRRQGRVEEASELFAQTEFHVSGQLGLAALALDEGDHAVAAERAERFVERIPAQNVTERAAGYEIAVRGRAALGELEAAGAALAELRAVAEVAPTRLLRAAAAAAGGIVHAAAAAHDLARSLLEEAVHLFGEDGAPFDAARARADLARSLAALGRDEDAVAEAREASRALGEMGARAEAKRVDALLGRLTRGEGEARGPLTARQLEVLRLVAEGLSNQEIAKRLVISEHTVKRHLTNILTKLGVTSRAAAVGRAGRDGLL